MDDIHDQIAALKQKYAKPIPTPEPRFVRHKKRPKHGPKPYMAIKRFPDGNVFAYQLNSKGQRLEGTKAVFLGNDEMPISLEQVERLQLQWRPAGWGKK
jgi:hypothetical protein